MDENLMYGPWVLSPLLPPKGFPFLALIPRGYPLCKRPTPRSHNPSSSTAPTDFTTHISKLSLWNSFYSWAGGQSLILSSPPANSMLPLSSLPHRPLSTRMSVSQKRDAGNRQVCLPSCPGSSLLHHCVVRLTQASANPAVKASVPSAFLRSTAQQSTWLGDTACREAWVSVLQRCWEPFCLPLSRAPLGSEFSEYILIMLVCPDQEWTYIVDRKKK